MYFRQVWKLLLGFRMSLPIISGVTQHRDVQVFFMKCMQPPSRASGRRTFHEYFGQNGVNRGPDLRI